MKAKFTEKRLLIVSGFFNVILALAWLRENPEELYAAVENNPQVSRAEGKQTPPQSPSLVRERKKTHDSDSLPPVKPGWVTVPSHMFMDACRLGGDGSLTISGAVDSFLKLSQNENDVLQQITAEFVSEVKNLERINYEVVDDEKGSYFAILPFKEKLRTMRANLQDRYSAALGSKRGEVFWHLIQGNPWFNDGNKKRKLSFSQTDDGDLYFDDNDFSLRVEPEALVFTEDGDIDSGDLNSHVKELFERYSHIADFQAMMFAISSQ